MLDTAHTEEKDGITIKIIADEDAQNPFTEWDGLPDLIGWHRRYNFNTRKEDKNVTPEDFQREAKAQGYIIRPLFMYDHSGLAFSTAPFSCQWDSGQLGFIFFTPEKIKTCYGDEVPTPEQLEANFASAIETLNDYHSGDVYGFVIEDEDGNELDSCWGFFGDYEDYCLKEARDRAEYHAKQKREASAEKVAQELEESRPDFYAYLHA